MPLISLLNPQATCSEGQAPRKEDSFESDSRFPLCPQRLYSQSYGFPVVMYGCKSWTIKKVECRKMDAFELWR